MTDNNDLLERLVVAVEGLLDINKSLADQTSSDGSDAGPPLCPNCSKLNPTIHLDQTDEMEGPFSGWGLTALCKECDKIFYALPDGWTTLKDKEEFNQVLKQRTELINLAMKGI